MQPDLLFRDVGPVFWANVKTISQQSGYTNRAHGLTRSTIKRHDEIDIREAFRQLRLSTEHLFAPGPMGSPTVLGAQLLDYFQYRADVLEQVAEPNLMDVAEARAAYRDVVQRHQPQRPPPMNKQKGDKAGPAYLTAIVNAIVESEVGDDCDYDPRALTTVTRDGLPVRTLSRRVDGAYPSAVNPTAIWEIKEYYFTTTFGSRIADGVYETMLDGLELDELNAAQQIHVQHVLMVDSHRTWWEMGKSYLCRLVDIMNMGYVDEVLCGQEVLTRLPELVQEWIWLRNSE